MVGGTIPRFAALGPRKSTCGGLAFLYGHHPRSGQSTLFAPRCGATPATDTPQPPWPHPATPSPRNRTCTPLQNSGARPPPRPWISQPQPVSHSACRGAGRRTAIAVNLPACPRPTRSPLLNTACLVGATLQPTKSAAAPRVQARAVLVLAGICACNAGLGASQPQPAARRHAGTTWPFTAGYSPFHLPQGGGGSRGTANAVPRPTQLCARPALHAAPKQPWAKARRPKARCGTWIWRFSCGGRFGAVRSCTWHWPYTGPERPTQEFST